MHYFLTYSHSHDESRHLLSSCCSLIRVHSKHVHSPKKCNNYYRNVIIITLLITHFSCCPPQTRRYRVAKTHRIPSVSDHFPKRAINYRSLLRKMTYKDKGTFESAPPCRFLLSCVSPNLFILHTGVALAYTNRQISINWHITD